MESDPRKAMGWTAIFVAAVGALANLPALVIGLSFLRDWIQLLTWDGPYFRWHYLLTASICLLISGFGLALAVQAMRRDWLCGFASIASLFLGLACMVALPEVGPRLDMSHAVTKLLGHADHSLSDWDEAHGRFPSDEKELRMALSARPLRESAIFFVHGEPIAYDVQIRADATGPSLETVPPNPGTVIYAVASDYKEYWLTITSLRNSVGGPVRLEHVPGDFEREPVWVLYRKHHNPGEGHYGFLE
jgi:hypothetical protein